MCDRRGGVEWRGAVLHPTAVRGAVGEWSSGFNVQIGMCCVCSHLRYTKSR